MLDNVHTFGVVGLADSHVIDTCTPMYVATLYSAILMTIFHDC